MLVDVCAVELVMHVPCFSILLYTHLLMLMMPQLYSKKREGERERAVFRTDDGWLAINENGGFGILTDANTYAPCPLIYNK